MAGTFNIDVHSLLNTIDAVMAENDETNEWLETLKHNVNTLAKTNDREYNRGLDDCWEMIKKLYLKGVVPTSDWRKVFPKINDVLLGDKIITAMGETGVITDICTCDKCVARGFNEPTWVSDEDGQTHYITDYDASIGFIGYYKIGKYRFDDLDETSVLQLLDYHKKQIKNLKKRLKLIENIKTVEKLENMR